MENISGEREGMDMQCRPLAKSINVKGNSNGNDILTFKLEINLIKLNVVSFIPFRLFEPDNTGRIDEVIKLSNF